MTAKTQKSATEAFEVVLQSAQSATNLDVRDARCLKVGDIVRQGDVYFHIVPESFPHGAARADRQLAVGTTQGSRHIAEPPAEVFEGTTLPNVCDRGTFLGPFFRTAPGEDMQVSHPEHAFTLFGDGQCVQVTHQTDMITRQRTAD